MHPLNYTRRIRANWGKNGLPSYSGGGIFRNAKESASMFLACCGVAEKFTLPPNGVIIDDWDLRGIDDSMELRLPYPGIIIEYESVHDGVITGREATLCWEGKSNEYINMLPVITMDNINWMPMFPVCLPRVGGIKRLESGLVLIERWDIGEPSTEHDIDAYNATYIALLHLLNALSCVNVTAELVCPRKKNKKSSLEFDEYRVLVVGSHGKNTVGGNIVNGGRSPREHLRRGHIRRLHDGRKVWVNAAVINAGKGAGRITKDYAIKGATRRG